MSKVHNLFISHSWSYSESYDGLISLLDKKTYFMYKNHSVPKNDPIHNAPYDYQLYEAIKNKINGVHVVLILAGVYSSYSKWIDKEIQIAQEEFSLPKPIIAIEPWGAEKTSQKVKNAADKVVKWNTNSIVSAIRELS